MSLLLLVFLAVAEVSLVPDVLTVAGLLLLHSSLGYWTVILYLSNWRIQETIGSRPQSFVNRTQITIGCPDVVSREEFTPITVDRDPLVLQVSPMNNFKFFLNFQNTIQNCGQKLSEDELSGC